MTKTFFDFMGRQLVNIHDPQRCAGQACVFHNPSEHKMRDWPICLRLTLLVERMCEHGVGHPDPDSSAWMDRAMGHEPGTWGTHGCDGCCADPVPERAEAA